MPASLRVTQTRSTISHIARNRATIRALGLHGIGSSSILPDNPAVRGMVRQVRFLVTVEELPGGRGRDDPGEALMKIHDLHPAEGSVTKRTRVGRGIAAGKGKTAGRGTKGQKSRAGASIPAWFEGGQTPLHIRIPKLRGFRNINDVEYEVVNVGAISAAIDAGKLEVQKGAPVTVNADTLKQAGPGPSRPPAAQGARQRRRQREAVRARRRLHPQRAREDRGRRRHRPGHRDPDAARSRPSGSTSPPTRDAGKPAAASERRPRDAPRRDPRPSATATDDEPAAKPPAAARPRPSRPTSPPPPPPSRPPRPEPPRTPPSPGRPRRPTRPTRPTTASAPCSRRCSTRSARRTSGAASCSSPGSCSSSGCSRTSRSRASTRRS